MLHTGYTSAKKLLMEELKQREEEGFAVPETLREKAENIPETAREESLYLEIYEKLDHLEKRMDFPFVEPDELEEIRAERPFRRLRKYPVTLSDKELLDRNHGAWLGRCVGCALGKPVESMGMSGNRWRDIRAYLKHRGDWPLSDYFSGRDAGDGLRLTCPDSQREQIRWMESDDDIRYTLVGLRIFELHGMDFTFLEIADLWNRLLPMGFCCTAERQALLNFNLLRGNPNALDRRVIRTYRNPYREWIGAQIRADFFGFAAAGNPELAAEFAWRDASWTHVKNGIYGEMFFAALASASYVVSDLRERVEIALGEIPENCRLADAVRRALQEIPRHESVEALMPWMEEHFGGLSPVHTIGNAVICLAALFYGQGSPDRSVCEAVSGGLDTDCNGATVGAIAGIHSGKADFGGKLAAALHDTIKAGFGDFTEISLKELAQRTLAVQRKIFLRLQEKNAAL